MLPTYPWHFWVAGPGWLASLWYNYWLFTGDRRFLRDRAWPLNREIIDFCVDYLQIGDDGKYLFSPSFSRENAPGNSDCYPPQNAIMDVAVAREVLVNAIEIGKELQEDAAQLSVWRDMPGRLPGYNVNGDGALCEWLHVSRSVVHMANVFARLGWEEEALECLDDCVRFFVGDNSFFHIQEWRGSGVAGKCLLSVGVTAFQIDGVLGFSAAVMEMLLYSNSDYIELLPALPASWSRGKISGLRARRLRLVSPLGEWNSV